jgi:hypothetical protein
MPEPLPAVNADDDIDLAHQDVADDIRWFTQVVQEYLNLSALCDLAGTSGSVSDPKANARKSEVAARILHYGRAPADALLGMIPATKDDDDTEDDDAAWVDHVTYGPYRAAYSDVASILVNIDKAKGMWAAGGAEGIRPHWPRMKADLEEVVLLLDPLSAPYQGGTDPTQQPDERSAQEATKETAPDVPTPVDDAAAASTAEPYYPASYFKIDDRRLRNAALAGRIRKRKAPGGGPKSRNHYHAGDVKALWPHLVTDK